MTRFEILFWILMAVIDGAVSGIVGHILSVI